MRRLESAVAGTDHQHLLGVVSGPGELNSIFLPFLADGHERGDEISPPLQKPGDHLAIGGSNDHFQLEILRFGEFFNQLVFKPQQFTPEQEIVGRVVGGEHPQDLSLLDTGEVIPINLLTAAGYGLSFKEVINRFKQVRIIGPEPPGQRPRGGQFHDRLDIIPIGESYIQDVAVLDRQVSFPRRHQVQNLIAG